MLFTLSEKTRCLTKGCIILEGIFFEKLKVVSMISYFVNYTFGGNNSCLSPKTKKPAKIIQGIWFFPNFAKVNFGDHNSLNFTESTVS